MNKVYIETYGCQMNEYDSELVKTILKENNFRITTSPENAQIIFLNTCSVRENAHQKVRQRLSVFRQLRKKKQKFDHGCTGMYGSEFEERIAGE